MSGSLVTIPRLDDDRGSLSIVEGEETIPFKIERVYYLHGIGPQSVRGAHAHKELQQLFIAMAGSFDVALHDGRDEVIYNLCDPSVGLLVPKMTWRSLSAFSSGAVCCVLASQHFKEDDYIRDFDSFVDLVSFRN